MLLVRSINTIIFNQTKALLYLAVQEKVEFTYCSKCNTLPVALVEAGMFPLSPTKPSGAIHFWLCDAMVKTRNVLGTSAEKLAELYNLLQQQGVDQKVLFTANLI